ncbi:MAG TPA: hypothetical protein VJN64_07695 [Terriglobales bacterium]|nr:hypothetical protein [Terriglobales bacterium]
MKLRILPALLPALLAVAIAAYASDVWNAKDYTQWSSEEIARVLNESPWAKQTSISFDLPGMQPENGKGRKGGFAGDGGYHGGPYPRRGRDPDENAPREMHGLPSFIATIRWESALPIQQALSRSSDGRPIHPSEKEYIIAVLGLPLPGGANQTDDVREQLLAYTKLVRKGKDPVAPSDVKVDASNAAGQVRFFFPRKDPISLDDREVTFETQLGKMRLEQKFRLKDMSYKGKLEL